MYVPFIDALRLLFLYLLKLSHYVVFLSVFERWETSGWVIHSSKTFTDLPTSKNRIDDETQLFGRDVAHALGFASRQSMVEWHDAGRRRPHGRAP